jgi:hypothetical protein
MQISGAGTATPGTASPPAIASAASSSTTGCSSEAGRRSPDLRRGGVVQALPGSSLRLWPTVWYSSANATMSWNANSRSAAASIGRSDLTGHPGEYATRRRCGRDISVLSIGVRRSWFFVHRSGRGALHAAGTSGPEESLPHLHCRWTAQDNLGGRCHETIKSTHQRLAVDDRRNLHSQARPESHRADPRVSQPPPVLASFGPRSNYHLDHCTPRRHW